MSVTTLSRIQFALTAVYHFFFVPLTLGLSVLVALMHTLYVATGQEAYKRMTRFWGTLFTINFAVGVVTGIVMEFQFGMNWSEYSRFVGDIFGAPLAIEALLAFFLESTFLGIWIFGWDRLPKKVHLLSIWLVALGSNVSALWILIANSFMQQPVGFALRGTRAEMTDFLALILNPNVLLQFPHTVLAGLTTGAFFVMGISAYHLVRRSHVDIFRRSFQIGAVIGLIAIALTGLAGHAQTQHKARVQPMKIAAAEALWETQNPASFSLLTIGDLQGREVFSLRIPRLLSLLVYNRPTGEVKGINELQAQYEQEYGPGDYRPPVWMIYWSFHIMVGLGFLMLALAAYGLFLARRGLLERPPRLLRVFPYAIALPYLANTTGWLMAEVGRFPWAVQGLVKIEDAISPNLTPGMVLTTLVGFTVIYGLLIAMTIYLFARFARNVELAHEHGGESAVPLPL